MKPRYYALSYIVILSIAISCKTSQKKPLNGGTGKKVYYTHNFVTELSFDYKNHIIAFSANINSGKDYRFILDSGAPTFITRQVVQDHHLRSNASAIAYDVSGNEQNIEFYTLDNITIAGKSFHHIEAAGNELTASMQVLKDRADGGLIGADIMNKYIWMINYQDRKIIITDHLDSLSIPENAIVSPMGTDNAGSPVIEVSLSGEKKLPFIIDIGYSGSVLLPAGKSTADIFNDSLSYSKREKLSTGFESSIGSHEYKFIRRFSAGNLNKENVKASTTGANTKALLGNEFLEDYTVVLDFRNKQLILIPAKDLATVCS
jgi:hypothetical protein